MPTPASLRRLALVALVFAGITRGLPAADAPSAPDTKTSVAGKGGDAETPPPSVLKKYDKNKNGALDEAERAQWRADLAARREKYQKQRQEMLAKYDLNKDGKISEEEKVAARMDMVDTRMERDLEKSREKAGERLAREEAEKARGDEAASGDAAGTAPAPVTVPEAMTPAASTVPAEDGMMMAQ